LTTIAARSEANAAGAGGATRPLEVWALGSRPDAAMLERLGDARLVADRIDAGVGALLLGADDEATKELIAHGADSVLRVAAWPGLWSSVATAVAALTEHAPRLVLAPGDCTGREWASLLAARLGWKLVSPALLVQLRGDRLEVTGLDRSGRRARTIGIASDETVVVTMRPGVAEALQADPARQGTSASIEPVQRPESVRTLQVIPADPASVDIRFAERLVAGGRGVGGREGFDTLRRFAARIRAGVAASRMAVDLGWIESERQVGQTGKTVSPGLYIACGISGASHHLEGMSEAQHIVAVNTDPEAPIFKVAHLGLVADLHEILERAEKGLAKR
jgi:electron transfer flavoprotein alpha subunit